MKFVMAVSSVAILALAIYVLMVQDAKEVMPYLMLLLGVQMFILGVKEFKRITNSYLGYSLFAIGMFILYISYQGFTAV
ncbi:DUF3953 domain-containing protein [Halobacillus litoralis]|uniref:DUF3953 domain-containing protein n=1 Tax=Halobacillus litoralis TaxID=45668 RepID=UPI001CD4215B|nr:DUF3953 domain-containing protein [Halobacillus litoralis]MCA0972179.1 DUF3953 domain-containing protein [Halobacillus litoralis]